MTANFISNTRAWYISQKENMLHSHAKGQTLVGWRLTAFSAQTGYIMPQNTEGQRQHSHN